MHCAIKNKKKIVKAYQLGAGSDKEMQLIREGTIILRDDGLYELFSQEAVNGTGEVARPGDYFKVSELDGKHYPYPNEKEWFESNHNHLEGDTYEQLNKPLAIWEVGDPESEEINYLKESGKLIINVQDEEHFFNAFLWGADLSASKDAILIFYSVDRDSEGTILDISFNFVARREFENSYSYYAE